MDDDILEILLGEIDSYIKTAGEMTPVSFGVLRAIVRVAQLKLESMSDEDYDVGEF